MKTREEFLAAVKAYRSKTRAYSFLWLPLLLFLFVWPLLLSEVLEHFQLVPNNFSKMPSPLAGLIMFFWFGPMIALMYFVNNRVRRIVASCGLICPECAHTVDPAEIKLITATHNCPCCGLPFFK